MHREGQSASPKVRAIETVLPMTFMMPALHLTIVIGFQMANFVFYECFRRIMEESGRTQVVGGLREQQTECSATE